MALTDKVAPETGTSFEGHRRGPFGGQSSSVARPQGNSESSEGLGRSATRQLRGFRCHRGDGDKATPGTGTARSFSNKATPRARRRLVAKKTRPLQGWMALGRSATRRLQRRGVGWSVAYKATPGPRRGTVT